MSRSHARNVNTASLITLCPVCLHAFQDARKVLVVQDRKKKRIGSVFGCWMW